MDSSAGVGCKSGRRLERRFLIFDFSSGLSCIKISLMALVLDARVAADWEEEGTKAAVGDTLALPNSCNLKKKKT